MSRKKTSENYLKKREAGFDIVSIPHARLNEYSALHDPNMRHYFENPKVQRLLYETGQIDKHGRVIDLEKNKSKLNILEREFKKAEQMEEERLKDEAEMRVSCFINLCHSSKYCCKYRVQRTRFNELEKTRKQDLLRKMKADINLSKEMLSTMKSAVSMPPSRAMNVSPSPDYVRILHSFHNFDCLFFSVE